MAPPARRAERPPLHRTVIGDQRLPGPSEPPGWCKGVGSPAPAPREEGEGEGRWGSGGKGGGSALGQAWKT